MTVNATFALQDYTISLGEGIEHGTVTFEPTTAHMGQNISVTATPEDGFELASLEYEYTEDTGAPKRVAIENNQFVMPASDVTILATFRAKIYNIATSVNPEGAGNINVPATAAYQSEVEVTVTPAAGYQLKEMYYTYTFVMPASAVNVNAAFVLDQSTAIDGINLDNGQGRRYVNPMGQMSDRPLRGVNIVIDGDRTYKVVK